MRRPIVLAAALLTASAGALAAHDLFLRPATYFARPHATVTVSVLNGTFTESEGGVGRDRLVDLSLVGPDGRARLDTAAWTVGARRSAVSVRLGPPGTYVVGASLRPRALTLSGADFTAYLKEEGIGDVLEARRQAGAAADSARERYAKHVKTLVQVGDAGASDSYRVPLGYPAEIVPLENPYALRRGATLRVRCLVDGAPAAGVTVIAGGRTPRGARLRVQRATADAAGEVGVRLDTPGEYYVKFIRLAPTPGDSVQYESKWATLTFAVR